MQDKLHETIQFTLNLLYTNNCHANAQIVICYWCLYSSTQETFIQYLFSYKIDKMFIQYYIHISVWSRLKTYYIVLPVLWELNKHDNICNICNICKPFSFPDICCIRTTVPFHQDQIHRQKAQQHHQELVVLVVLLLLLHVVDLTVHHHHRQLVRQPLRTSTTSVSTTTISSSDV